MQHSSSYSFLQHSTLYVPDSSNTNLEYLYSETCSNCFQFTITSHSNVLSPPNTSFSALTFRSLLLHTSTKHPIMTLISSSNSPHNTWSYVYKRQVNLLSSSLLWKSYSRSSHPHFNFFHHAIHALKKAKDFYHYSSIKIALTLFYLYTSWTFSIYTFNTA